MTAEQLFRLSEEAHSSLKKRGITAALLLDAEAAFDQAWHDGIRYKVDKIGLPKRIVRLISSFLGDRKLTVKVGNKDSKTISMGAGTPQGSCLSPLLYIILVNDVPTVDEYAEVGQFADDMATWANAETFTGCLSKLQKAVNAIEGWCRRWRIKINGTKSNLIFFQRLHKKPTQDLALQLFNDIVRPTATAKYLGIEFDERLSFKPHFDKVEKKAASRLNVFKLLVKNGVENEVLIRLYKTYVRPLLEYGSIAYLAANTQCLQQLQNEFIRLALKLPRYIRTSLIHEAAGLELVGERLLCLNRGLMTKMRNLEAVNDVMLRSAAVNSLNNYATPLDKLRM